MQLGVQGAAYQAGQWLSVSWVTRAPASPLVCVGLSPEGKTPLQEACIGSLTPGFPAEFSFGFSGLLSDISPSPVSVVRSVGI